MLMIIKVSNGEAIVCEEHEVADAVTPWIEGVPEEVARESAEVLQFALMRGDDTRRLEFRLGVAIRR